MKKGGIETFETGNVERSGVEQRHTVHNGLWVALLSSDADLAEKHLYADRHGRPGDAGDGNAFQGGPAPALTPSRRIEDRRLDLRIDESLAAARSSPSVPRRRRDPRPVQHPLCGLNLRELIDECEITLQREVNCVTHNPINFPWELEKRQKSGHRSAVKHINIRSGGYFHGLPLAIHIYNPIQAMVIKAGLINQYCARFVDVNRNKGLDWDLKWPDMSEGLKAISSSMMMPECTSAALENSIWGEAVRGHLFNISQGVKIAELVFERGTFFVQNFDFSVFDDVGSDDAGAKGCGVDTVPAQFNVHHFRKTANRELDRGVRRQNRQSGQASSGRGIDNMSVTLFDNAGKEEMNSIDNSEKSFPESYPKRSIEFQDRIPLATDCLVLGVGLPFNNYLHF